MVSLFVSAPLSLFKNSRTSDHRKGGVQWHWEQSASHTRALA